MAPWLLHCSKLCPRSFMPLTTRSKGASTMTDPRILEVAPTKGCSKQIHDLLAGGRFLLVPGCFCVGPSQIVSFANSIRIAPWFWHIFLGNWQFHCFISMFLKLQEQNTCIFWMKCTFIHTVLMVVWMGPHVNMHICVPPHDEISRMFTRWSHELAWGDAYYMSM